EGRTILRVEFSPLISDQPLPAEELDRRLGLHPNSPLHLPDIKKAIENLYATGRYSDIAIESQSQADGVALRVVTDYNYFISRVSIEGESDPPNRDQPAAATKLELGAPFTDSQMGQAMKNMQDRLRANGFYSARIESRVDRTPATEEASIYFVIDTGD